MPEQSALQSVPWGSLAAIIGGAFVALFVVVLLFFALRALWLWYFRINEVVVLLTSIDASLRAIRAVQAPPAAKPVERWTCPNLECGAKNAIAATSCAKCGAPRP